MQPHRRQPTRLPRPWDSPGKNTGVGCHFLFQCMKVRSESEVAQSCLTLRDPMDCSPPGSSIHGIFWARVLEQGGNMLGTRKTKANHQWALLGRGITVHRLKFSGTLPWPTTDLAQVPFVCPPPNIWHCPTMAHGVPGKEGHAHNSTLQERNTRAKAMWATNIRGSLLIPILLGLILNKNMKWVLWNLFLFFPKPENQKTIHHIEQSSSFVLMATNDKNRKNTYKTSNRHRVVEINF